MSYQDIRESYRENRVVILEHWADEYVLHYKVRRTCAMGLFLEFCLN